MCREMIRGHSRAGRSPAAGTLRTAVYSSPSLGDLGRTRASSRPTGLTVGAHALKGFKLSRELSVTALLQRMTSHRSSQPSEPKLLQKSPIDVNLF